MFPAERKNEPANNETSEPIVGMLAPMMSRVTPIPSTSLRFERIARASAAETDLSQVAHRAPAGLISSSQQRLARYSW
jgi:hypothetical protein